MESSELTKELIIAATVENISLVTAFVDELLETLDCPLKTQMQIDIAIDEPVSYTHLTLPTMAVV